MSVDTADLLIEKTPLARFKVFLMMLLAATIGLLLAKFVIADFFINIGLMIDGAIAAYIFVWAIPIAVGLPVFLILVYLGMLRLLDKERDPIYQRSLNLAFIISFVALLVRLPIGFVLDAYASNKGYSYCYWYTSPANLSPQVWVRSPEYCIEQTGVVRRPLMEWLQSLPDGGNQVTPAEVRAKALEMLAAYEAGERFLD